MNCNERMPVSAEETRVRAKLETIQKLLSEAGNMAHDIDLIVTGDRPEKACNPTDSSSAILDVLDRIIDNTKHVMDYLYHISGAL